MLITVYKGRYSHHKLHRAPLGVCRQHLNLHSLLSISTALKSTLKNKTLPRKETLSGNLLLKTTVSEQEPFCGKNSCTNLFSKNTSASEKGLHSMLNRSKPLCQYFNTKSGCKFKENCKFLHSSTSISNSPASEKHENGKPVTNLEGTSSLSDTFSLQLSFENQHHEAVKENTYNNTPKPCFSFERYGNCKYGNNCRFLHALPSDEKVKTSKSARSFIADKKPQHASKKTKHDKQDQGRRRICHYFQEGHCQKGDKCRFYHPNNANKVEVSDVIIQGDKEQLEIVKSSSGSEEVNKTDRAAAVANKKYAPRPGQRRAPHIPVQPVKELKRESLLEKEIEELRLTEIEQLKKRLASSNFDVITDDENSFSVQFDFSSTDPDWVRIS